jgi:hypothetical protein
LRVFALFVLVEVFAVQDGLGIKSMTDLLVVLMNQFEALLALGVLFVLFFLGVFIPLAVLMVLSHMILLNSLEFTP